MKRLIFVFTLCIMTLLQTDLTAQWHYIQIDSTKQKWGDWAEPNWLRYFGLAAGDINRDGCVDIVSGRYIYRNPCAEMDGVWSRQVLDDNVDAILMLNVDNDPYADIIAQALPHVYWYEAIDQESTAFTRKKIADVPATSHVNSQGFVTGNLSGDDREEIIIAGNGNIYAIAIPESPSMSSWKTSLICTNTSDEGIGIGDIDGDGLMDIAAGRRPPGEDEPTIMVWYKNPGSLQTAWQDSEVGKTDHPIDRIRIADVNGDERPDIIMTEERYPGLKPDAHLNWFSQPLNRQPWTKHTIVEQYSMNNLDIADIDDDGDIDILTNEHKGQKLELQWWLNDGSGSFIKKTIDTGKENHLGTQLVDLDQDGDLDIIGAGWDQYRYMHVWRNDKSTSLKMPEQQPLEVQRPEKSIKPKSVSNRIGPIKETEYQGRTHFLIKTPTLTYYYDIKGGGISRIIDPQGNDWISFKTEPAEDYPAAAAGAFRGLPNAVFQSAEGGAGHPGFDHCASTLVGSNQIVSTTKSGVWQWRWTFFEDHARCTFEKVSPTHPYWFLYEGTPGGSFAPEEWYFGTDQFAPTGLLPDYFSGSPLLGHFQWVYFGHKANPGVLYLKQHSPDEHPDIISYLGNDSDKGLSSPDGMTVFGFGRDNNTQALLTAPMEFTIGFYPYQISNQTDHDYLKQYLSKLSN